MHLKVFVKLKKTLKTLSSGQKNPKKPKKTQKNPKNPKKPKKNQKNPLGWFFFKKPGFFPTLPDLDSEYGSGSGSTDMIESGTNPDPQPWKQGV
jgi:hypothetical protein